MPSPEKFYVNPKDVERSEFRHRLVAEFRDALEGHYAISDDVDGIVVLSAAPALEFAESDRREKTPENISRIDFAFDIPKQIAAKRLGKKLADITEEDFIDPAVIKIKKCGMF